MLYIRNMVWPRYLLWFAQDHVDFRYPEIQSITKIFNIPIRYIEKPTINQPFWIVELPEEKCAKQIASRSVSLKTCIELWGRAKTATQLHTNLRKGLENNTGEWLKPVQSDLSDKDVCPSELIKSCCSESKSFKIEVETFCKHFSMKEKIDKIEDFSYIPFLGPVRLKDPDVKLCYYEFYGTDPNNIPDEPYDLFFGKWITDGQRDLIQHHSLKQRSFIGNTSMDAQLALLMANQGLVDKGDVVIDPFVGSGSLLVAAAHFGGFVWGTDIDYLMLHARTRPTRVNQKVRKRDESIRKNMRQYGTESCYLDVVVSDFSLPLWREDMRFDSIITDPPYGVREPTERIGIDKDNYTLSEAHLQNHVPAKVEYGLPDIMSDLMHFAAKYLKVGGRLVFWYPYIRYDYTDEMLPSHPCLHLLSNSEQTLSKLTGRRLLTYEKRMEIDKEVIAFSGGHDFREKYFSSAEVTRKERRERRAAELVANAEFINKSINSKK